MRLLLSGGGEPHQVKKLDVFFANSININKKVLYIPVAMDKIPYEKCFEWFKSTYEKYGIKNIEMGIDLNKIKNLEKYEAIFIGGGNTFKLLKEIRESKFDIKLKKYLENNGFVYGGSAGAIIFGKSIDTSSHSDKNKVGLKNLDGLNLMNEYKIWCHYNIAKDKEYLKNIDGKMIFLYEESGIFFDGDNFKSIGKKYKKVESN